MLNLDMDLLRAFVAVADTGGFTSAARKLHRTQSAVSMQVKRIEALLGKRVLDRSGRSVKLTNHGEILLSHARRILTSNEQAIAELVHPDIEGPVRLAIPDTYGTYYLPKVFAQFLEKYPDVQLSIESELTDDIHRDLSDGKLDLALGVRDDDHANGEYLWTERPVWAGNENSSTHEKDPLPLAMFSPTCPFRVAVLKALDECGRRWRVVFSGPSLAAVQAGVLSGFAVGAIHESTLLPGMRVLGEAEGLPELQSTVVELHRRSGELSPAADRLADHLVEYLRRTNE